MFKRITIVVLTTFSLISCFKEIDEAKALNTNIFDRDYTGEKWFNTLDVTQYSNDLGQIRVNVKYEIPFEKLPDLRSSYLLVATRKGSDESVPWSYKDLPLNKNGGYSGSLDFPKNDEDNYCLTLGFLVEEDSTVINQFSECVSL